VDGSVALLRAKMSPGGFTAPGVELTQQPQLRCRRLYFGGSFVSGRNPAEELISTRKGVIEVVIFALIIALGVNLLSASMEKIWSKNPYIPMTIGALCLLFGAIFLLVKILSSTIRNRYISGVQIMDSRTRRIVYVKRYRFSEKSKDHIDAICAENKAIKRMWEEGDLSPSKRDEFGNYSRNISSTHKLQKEEIEYFVLDQLSTHLTDYFNHRRDKLGGVITFGRRDIPAVLMDNRFLEMFSRPMEEREGFNHHGNEKARGETRGEIIYAMGSGGQRFERFDLTLPKGSTVFRKLGDIVIKTPRFEMKISTEFEGYGAVIEPYFAEKYLGVDWGEINSYKVGANISVKFNPLSIFTPSGWGYYQWVDSFLDSIEKKLSFRDFKKNIGWEVAYTASILANSEGARPTKPPRRSK